MIDLRNISVQFTGNYLFQDVSLKINSGDKLALVGSNGSGKSSLLNIISGKAEPENGTIQKQKNISIGYLPQEQIVHKGKNLIDEVSTAMKDIKFLQTKEDELLKKLESSDLSDEENGEFVIQLGDVQIQLEELDSYGANHKIEKVLMGLGFEEKDFLRLTDEFSGGWQMRIALAKIIAAQNDLLLIDEPTNHLDLDSLEWITDFIQNFKGSVVSVSHDRNFLNDTTNKTIEIFNGKISLYNGNIEAFLKYKSERNEQLVNQRVNQLKKIKETERFIERFRYKATKAKQVQSRVKQLEKISITDLPENEKTISINFPQPPKSGVFNVELNRINKSFGQNQLFKGIDLRIKRGDKIAFVGPNGSGKTTLAKILAGKLQFEKGERIEGHNNIVSYYSQDVADSLNPEITVLETVEMISENKNLSHLRTLLGTFLFTGDDVFKKVSVLSGGEKSRLALAKILLSKSNFIILDEPTNHLDYSSKAVLQNALVNFSGSLVLVSHDVEFLSPIVNHVVDVRKGKLKIFEGGIEYYLSKRKEILESDNVISTKKSSEESLKKDQKRIEAELRQKRFRATKDLKEKILLLENEIEKFEINIADINKELFNPDSYDDHFRIKELNNKLIELKSQLELKTKEWEVLSAQLEEVEKRFV
ncbi:MAG: ABC-F family ATP-binding cassette domain-containing protein [Ignavibacteria bacterium]|nr:ABC-F family ATP-binding cassette domain-containing protein [Ignavibacteria bacterium]MBT8383929.1 ABC-F family ATP-binding cassette domain-containing protein [Ignavibacteria bacterium]MBT8391470.1 ABC-F family ATP-binding cassette domain-containing protein [Ignavibacteria bacterium]NNJ54133.1 ABC-F family ATP-binding cassette domain-containing protein [Ignavibacteriaceae bacterium]NNL21400.1 ABC-F family ATP-binding cassette domain-containing protein [Ignavibacteriaceae bacterium]